MEEPQDAKCAENAHDACLLVLNKQGNDGHHDDKRVHLAPPISDEGPEPVGERVDCELDDENGGEEKVQILDQVGCACW